MSKAWSLLLAVLAVAAIAGLLALTIPFHIPVLEAFEFSSILVQISCVLLLVVGLVVLVAGVLQLAKGRRAQASPFLRIMSVLAPLASLPPAAYALLLMKIGIDQAHTTNLAVIAPGAIDLLMPLALGLAIGAIAGLSNFPARPATRS